MSTPHDVQAERSLIGSMMIWPHKFVEVRPVIAAEDFYAPQLADMWDVLDRLALAGQLDTDITALARKLDEAGVLAKVGGHAGLVEFTASASASPVVVAEGIVRLRALRDLQAIGLHAARDAVIDGADPEAIKRELLEAGNAIGVGRNLVKPITAMDLIESTEVIQNDWVLPNLLRRTHRAVTVAAEGVGKSLVNRLVAACGAAGLCPFTRHPIPPIKTLLIDLENPPDAIRRTFTELQRAIDHRAKTTGIEGHLDNAIIYSRLDRLNLRTPKGRAEIEQVIAEVRPDLVIFGPLYKAMHVEAREPYDLAASEVQEVIDDLRQRYDCAWLIEHHAPHNDRRRPFGSSAWLRWPELGVLIEKDDERGGLKIGRWRGDRVEVVWPNRLDRDQNWILTGYYEGGMPWSQSSAGF